MKFRSLALLTVCIVVVGALLWYVRNNDPAIEPFFLTCYFHKLTGLHCPGCGGTRAAHAFLNGDIAAAIAWNPFVFLVIPVILLLCAYHHRMRKRGSLGVKYLGQGVLIVVIAFFVLRNVPNPQHGLLAPWNIRGTPVRDSR